MDINKLLDLDAKDEVVVINGNEFILQHAALEFDEAKLNGFLQQSAGWYNYYGQRLADAESWLQLYDQQYDSVYAERFRGYKEDGGSDKLAEAKAKSDPDVEAAKKKVIVGKRAMRKLQLFLRAMDKAHDNAMNFGYLLRKEMDKIQPHIKQTEQIEMEKEVDAIVKAAAPA